MTRPPTQSRRDRRLAFSLALVAGYVDGYGLIALGTYVSFMSGNTTQTGAMTGHGNLSAAIPSGLAIVFFLVGAIAGTTLMTTGHRHSRRLLYGSASALLAMVVYQRESIDSWLAIATLSLAMGSMNATLSHIGAEPVSLTFVTGTLNKLGQHLSLFLMRAPLSDAQGPWDSHLFRAGLLASIWSSFMIGAFLAGVATSHFGAMTLLPPACVLTLLAVLPRSGSRASGSMSSSDSKNDQQAASPTGSAEP